MEYYIGNIPSFNGQGSCKRQNNDDVIDMREATDVIATQGVNSIINSSWRPLLLVLDSIISPGFPLRASVILDQQTETSFV